MAYTLTGFHECTCSGKTAGRERAEDASPHSLGRIEKVVSSDDVVILKPNAQRWNHHMTNTNAMTACMMDPISRVRFIIFSRHA